MTSVKSRKDGDSIETVDQKGVHTLLDTAEQAGIRRFIYVSYSKTIPDDMPLSVGKRAAEKRLMTGQWDYTILRPSHFAETWLSPAVGFDIEGGKVRIHGDGKAGISYIAEDYVARGVVACVDNPATVRADIDYGGPAAVSQLEAVALGVCRSIGHLGVAVVG